MRLHLKGTKMLFYVKYQVDRDKQSDTQAFFANMSEEEREKEIPDGVNLVGRWHDLPNGWGVAIVEAESQEALTGWAMSWSGACTFPVITPVVDDDTGTKLLKQMQG
jgi:hypothetical protein